MAQLATGLNMPANELSLSMWVITQSANGRPLELT